jgi:putative salt-induced outer membrane protein YdiY
MRIPRVPFASVSLALLLIALGLARAARAEDADKVLGWSDVAELSVVAARGNAESDTIGFKNVLTRTWERATFQLTASGLRAETGTITRFAVGTPDDFQVVENTDSELSAENYHLRGRYDRELNERWFWFAGAGWEKSEFAGIDNRYSVVAGAGTVWFDTGTVRFKTDYGATFTRQEDVVEDPSIDESFLGLRLSYDYWRKLTESTEYGSTLVVDENLDETDDLRADFTNWLGVAISERLALKVTYQLLYDRQPALRAVPLFSPGGVDTGTTVLAELDDLDSLLTVALVVNF